VPDVLFHRLRVSEVIPETGDACSLVFELSPAQREHFHYRPGQFLTLRLPGGDGANARCYSMSSSPDADPHLKVTVKRVVDGYASNWICDNAASGTEFDVLGPAGVFTPPSLDEDLLLFAGGSGITPIMSILKSLLPTGTGRATLVYANRDEDSIIFRAELDSLMATYPGRLEVVHWLDSVHGLPGTDEMTSLVRDYAHRESFICGPRPFMDTVRTVLRDLGVPRARIHIERFTSLAGNPFENAKPAEQESTVDTAARVEVEFDGEQHTFDWPEGVRLLDLLRSKGVQAPSSCSEGICAACECRVLEGEVRMVNNQVLEEDDLEEGYVLACQALPVTKLVRITYS
jgi:3-ketosteroid 9alpha-monooxygenase subunit B